MMTLSRPSAPNPVRSPACPRAHVLPPWRKRLSRYAPAARNWFLAVIAVGVAPNLGVSSTASAAVQSPLSPRGCDIPAGAVRVSTADELKTELARTTPQDIEIADGTYAPISVLKVVAPHRIWGSHADAVTVQAGFTFAGKGAPGFEVHCLTLDVSDTKTADRRSGTSIIYAVQKWTDITVADSRLLGNMKIGRAIFAVVPTGLVVERSEIRGFAVDGIRIKTGPGRATFRDLDISDIEKPGPGNLSGRGEAGIFVDSAATIERVRIRNAFWMSIGTYAHDIEIRDLDIDGSLAGVYVERYTHRLLIEDFYIGPGVKRGINFESMHSGTPTSVDVTIQDGVIEAYRIGVAVNSGQQNTTVQRVTFRNQCGVGIIGNRWKSSGGVFVDNDFSGIDAKAVEMSTKHPNAFKCS